MDVFYNYAEPSYTHALFPTRVVESIRGCQRASNRVGYTGNYCTINDTLSTPSINWREGAYGPKAPSLDPPITAATSLPSPYPWRLPPPCHFPTPGGCHLPTPGGCHPPIPGGCHLPTPGGCHPPTPGGCHLLEACTT